MEKNLNKSTYLLLGFVAGSVSTFVLNNYSHSNQETQSSSFTQENTDSFQPAITDKKQVKTGNAERPIHQSNNELLTSTQKSSQPKISISREAEPVNDSISSTKANASISSGSKGLKVGSLREKFYSLQQENPSVLMYDEKINCDDDTCSLGFKGNNFPHEFIPNLMKELGDEDWESVEIVSFSKGDGEDLNIELQLGSK